MYACVHWMNGRRGLVAALSMLIAAQAIGCGGRAYDTSTRTVSCGRVGFGEPCVTRGVASRRARIRACYEAELAAAPSLAGTITVELTVEEDGEATGVHASDDTVGSAAVRDCVLGVLDDLRFTPGSTGGPTVHSVPLVFEPTGG
jgi:hypothetical protein